MMKTILQEKLPFRVIEVPQKFWNIFKLLIIGMGKKIKNKNYKQYHLLLNHVNQIQFI
jgi:hypothetical protein